MGYLHINNLYKDTSILLFKECYAMEKIHGTSAHIAWKNGKLIFYAGGADHKSFINLFTPLNLEQKFKSLGHNVITIFGEAYGGKLQKMKATYGPELRFVAFDVKIENIWLDVPNAEDIVKKLSLQFVYYKKVSTDLETLNAERDTDSIQAIRNGMGSGKIREGIVLRPLIETTKNNDSRIIAKHKREEFMETRSPREVNPDKLQVLNEAKAIALEWVTEERLRHVLDKIPNAGIEQTGDVIKAMIEDITREAKGEIVDSKAARKTIGSRAAALFKIHLKENII